MSENIESIAQRSLIENALLKKNQLIFFALNLLMMIPQIAARYSPWALAGTVVILLVLFWRTVCVPGTDVPASRDLPLLGFFDFCILLVLSYQELADAFDPDRVLNVLESIGQRPHCLWLFLAGVVLSFIPVKNAAAVWCKGLAKMVMGAALLLFMWSTGVLTNLTFAPGGKAFFVFYLLCALLWYTLCAVAYHVSPDSRSRNNGLSWLLLAIFFAVCLTEMEPVRAFVSTRQEWFLAIPDAGFQWWKVILAAVVLTGCAVAAYDYDYRRVSADSLVLSTFAGGILLLRVLMSRYFACNWVLFLVFMAGSFQCLRNEQKQAKTFRLTSSSYLLAQLAALLAATELFKRGLWVSVILLCVYGVIFYTTAGKQDSPKRQLAHWLTLLSCPMVLAAAYIWRMRFILASCLFLVAAYVVFAFSICVLSWPHPSGQTCSNSYKWVICGFMTLLCLIAAGRYGTEVQVVFQPEDNSASITLKAKGKENEIQSAVCRWSDVTGQIVSGEQILSVGENVTPIQGEKLSIVVTDAFGAETTVTDWYPGWLLDID